MGKDGDPGVFGTQGLEVSLFIFLLLRYQHEHMCCLILGLYVQICCFKITCTNVLYEMSANYYNKKTHFFLTNAMIATWVRRLRIWHKLKG